MAPLQDAQGRSLDLRGELAGHRASSAMDYPRRRHRSRGGIPAGEGSLGGLAGCSSVMVSLLGGLPCLRGVWQLATLIKDQILYAVLAASCQVGVGPPRVSSPRWDGLSWLSRWVAVLGPFAGGLTSLLDTPRPPPGRRRPSASTSACARPARPDRQARGAPALFLVRPGKLSDAATLTALQPAGVTCSTSSSTAGRPLAGPACRHSARPWETRTSTRWSATYADSPARALTQGSFSILIKTS